MTSTVFHKWLFNVFLHRKNTRATGYNLIQEAAAPLICCFAVIRHTLLTFRRLIVTISLSLLQIVIRCKSLFVLFGAHM